MFLSAWKKMLVRTATEDDIKLAIKLKDNIIDLDLVDPNELKERAYEHHYVNGAIFREGYANPIRPNKENVGGKWITEEKYKQFMNQKLINDVVKSASSGFQDKTHWSHYISIATLIIVVLLLLGA